MWSSVVDPRVLAVRAARIGKECNHAFDAVKSGAWMLADPAGEHLLLRRDGAPVRLDVIEGTTAAGPVMLRFDIADDARLAVQLAELRSFAASPTKGHRHNRLAQRLLALWACDAREAGASLRQAADLILGPGDWPGDGDHRKSLIRRLILAGERMVCAGPQVILEKGERANVVDGSAARTNQRISP